MSMEAEQDCGLSILIAEDDDAAAHLIRTNLKRVGLGDRYFRARNGEEAVELLEGRCESKIPEYDRLLVLLDIRMPKMDGIQVLKYIKLSEKFRKIFVVMLTTSDRPKEVDICYRLGCNAYLKKQVDYSKLVESIKKVAAFAEVCEMPCFGNVNHE